MKGLSIILAAGAALVAISPSIAAEGCGGGFHRGPHGGCRPNERGGVVAPGVVVAPGIAIATPGIAIGAFYPGRGYWDGHRYWQHRERWKGGWRYR